MSEKIFIKDVRTYITSKKSGGDYHLQEKGHWIIFWLTKVLLTEFCTVTHRKELTLDEITGL